MESNQVLWLYVRAEHAVATRVIRRVRQELYLEALRDHELEMTPMPGCEIAVQWASDECRYEQMGRITEVLDPVPIMVMTLHGPARIIERRGNMRLRVAVPVEYGLVRAEGERILTTTLDLSATGLRFPCALDVWKGLHLKMMLHLGSSELNMTAQVSRVALKVREIRGKATRETAVTFVQIPLGDRQIIETFIQRHHRRQQDRLRAESGTNTSR